MAKHLHSAAGIDGVKASLLHEVLQPAEFNDIGLLAATIKALPLQLNATRPLDEAISTAGGVRFDALDEHFLINAARAARLFLRGRNARLGSADRRLPAHRVPCQWGTCGLWCFGAVKGGDSVLILWK